MIHKRTKLMLPLLVATLVCQAQTYFPLTGNGDGTWTLTSMPAYNVKIEVEYADVAFTAPTAKDGLTYTGEAQQLINAGVSEDGTMKYSLDGENFSEEIPTATLPGTYTVYYKIMVNNVSSEVGSLTSTIAKGTYALTNNGDGTWMIGKMRPYNVRVEVEYEDMVFTAPTSKEDLVYTGEAQQLINAGTSEDGTMKYSLDGENFSEEIPTATLPGTYTVYYKIVVNNVSSQVGLLTSTMAKATYALTNNGDGTWTLDQMPAYNVKLVVEYEDYVKLNGKGYATFSYDKDVTLTGAEVYSAKVSGDRLVCTKEGSDVPAYTGVILKGEANGEVTFTGAENATAITYNDLRATTTPTGTADFVTDALVLNGDKFVTFTGSAFDANKAYLDPSDVESNTLTIVFDSATSAGGVYEEGNTGKAPVKVLTENGTRIGEYNVTGQKLK